MDGTHRCGITYDQLTAFKDTNRDVVILHKTLHGFPPKRCYQFSNPIAVPLKKSYRLPPKISEVSGGSWCLMNPSDLNPRGTRRKHFQDPIPPLFRSRTCCEKHVLAQSLIPVLYATETWVWIWVWVRVWFRVRVR